MKGEVKEEVNGEVKEETNHEVEKMDTSAAAPADLTGTVMEVTKGKEFKVITIRVYTCLSFLSLSKARTMSI